MGKTFGQTYVELQLNSPKSYSKGKHHSHKQKASIIDHLAFPGADKGADVKQACEDIKMF